MKPQVGDMLFYAPGQRWQGGPRRVQVTKVGRKWITIGSNNRRFSADTLIAEDSAGGKLYFTEAEYLDDVHRNNLIRALHNATAWSGEDEITYDQAKACAKILHLDVPRPGIARIKP